MAYYLHWPFGDILDLEHPARVRIIGEIGDIHTEMRPSQPAPTLTD